MGLEHYLSLLAANGCRGGAADARTGMEQELQMDGQHIALWFVPADGYGGEAQLMARTDVALLPGAPSTALCRRLLQANAFWSGIRDGALGLRGTDVVMLSVSRRLASLDAEGLKALLQAMASDACRWAEVLRRPESLPPSPMPMPVGQRV